VAKAAAIMRAKADELAMPNDGVDSWNSYILVM